ncbi:hypothetical protein LINPERHAP2_LOCUS45111, partial [Linum perenne]
METPDPATGDVDHAKILPSPTTVNTNSPSAEGGDYRRGGLEDDDGGYGGLDSEQVERLMIKGMWCCHPDEMHWPSIRQ